MEERPKEAQHAAGRVAGDSVGGSSLRVSTEPIYSHISLVFVCKRKLLVANKHHLIFSTKVVMLNLAAWTSLILVTAFLLQRSIFILQAPSFDAANTFHTLLTVIFFFLP